VRNSADSAVPADPILEKLSLWVESTLGIKVGEESLQKLRDYLEQNFNPSIFEFPGTFIWTLSSREERFKIARCLTVNETYFFREEPHFDLLLKELLPLFARLNRPLRICSAATSSGCEAYSLAMLMDHYNRTKGPLDFTIEAFDLSRDMIEIAKQGRYTANAFRDDGNRWKYIMNEYLTEQHGEYIVNTTLKERIHFFPYNIMDGLEPDAFDLILFRNALIYFSPESRVRLVDSLANSLIEGGVLLFGISEAPSVNHPLLGNKNAQGAFYFQRVSATPGLVKNLHDGDPQFVDRRIQDRRVADRRVQDPRFADRRVSERRSLDRDSADRRVRDRRSADRRSLDRRSADLRSKDLLSGRSPPAVKPAAAKPARPGVSPESLHSEASGKTAVTINPKNIAALIEQRESIPAAEHLLKALRGRTEEKVDLTGDEIIAAVISLLSLEDFSGVELALSFVEKKQVSVFTKFLRGEYNYHLNRVKEAESGYQEASILDSAFWPAFYRMSLLAAEGNRIRYEYKIKKALESIELGRELNYECFIGGFSPDYYRRILEKRLSESDGRGISG
jgi:chemotaxis protein methyltransferase CheR